MIISNLFRLALLSFFMSSCSLFNSDRVIASFESKDNMAVITSAGQSFVMGSTDLNAPTEQKPSFEVKFDYSFELDSSEVTEKEYNTLMGIAVNALTEKLPIVNVSWYDAILFANAKSKQNGYDTVYSYTSLQKSNGSVNVMEGLKVDFSKSGFRLPTEAEWEYAAYEEGSEYPWPLGKENLYSWNSTNSQNTLHKVKQKEKNQWGIYDLAGNAMEWVGDWKGEFPSNSVTNFVGAPTPNSFKEIPLKGGSFRHGSTSRKSRSDAYPAGPASKANYVGFRLAKGVIPNPQYANAQGVVKTSQSQIIANQTQVFNFFKTTDVILTYVDYKTKQLSYVNFNISPLVIQTIYDTLPVFHPAPSPNGKWVAFSTLPEGLSGDSWLYVRQLNPNGDHLQKLSVNGAIPRWWIDPTTQDTFIVYNQNTSSNTDVSSWSNQSTFKIQWSQGSFKGNPIRLALPGSFNGGFSQDLQFFASGFTQLRTSSINSTQSQALFQSPNNGKTASGSSQVCNVSTSPNNSKNLLFIDFGYNQKSSLIGSNYGIHEYIFKADSHGIPYQWFKAPSGDKNWNYPEWSNREDYAVATSVNQNDESHAIWAINLKDSAYLKLIETENVWMPSLNVGLPSVNTIDTLPENLGRYSLPAGETFREIFAIKMNRFWHNYQNIEIAVLGSSHALNLGSKYFTGFNSVNLSYPAADFIGQNTIARNYLIKSPKLKMVILSMDWSWWRDDSLKWKENAGPSLGLAVDFTHSYWQNTSDLTPLIKQSDVDVQALGTFNDIWDQQGDEFETWGSSWGGPNPQIAYGQDWGWLIDFTGQKVWNDFTSLIQFFNQKGVHVVALEYPQSPFYAQTLSHGRYGPTHLVWNQINNSLIEYQKSHPLFHYMDENKNGLHDYEDTLALNWDHLNGYGGTKLAKRLSDSIHVWLK